MTTFTLIEFKDIKRGDTVLICSISERARRGVADALWMLYPEDPDSTEMVWDFVGTEPLGNWMHAADLYRVGE